MAKLGSRFKHVDKFLDTSEAEKTLSELKAKDSLRNKVGNSKPGSIAARNRYFASPEGKAKRKAREAIYNQTPDRKASKNMRNSKSRPERALRTPRWIIDKHHLPDNEAMKDIYRTAAKTGKAVDHGLPLLGKQVSGLDVPDNLNGMDPKANLAKGNRMPDDFLDWKWKHNEGVPGSGKKGRLSAWRKVPSSTADPYVRVPRSQGGFIDPKLLKNLGKVGLFAGASAALRHVAPDNPMSQARDRGYELSEQLGGLLGVGGIEEGISAIDNPYLRGAAHIGTGMFVDPLITAAGAGANMGDRLYAEMMGTNKKADIKRKGSGLAGRLQRGILDGS